MRVPRRWRGKLRTSSGREILAGGARRVHRRYHKQAEVAAKNPPRRILRRLWAVGYKCVAVSDGLSPAAGAAGLDSALRMTNANLATAFRRRQSPSRPTRWQVPFGFAQDRPPGSAQ